MSAVDRNVVANESKAKRSFADATATLSCATLAARRLPELKALWKSSSFYQHESIGVHFLRSAGCKTSSRHMRRRGTSYMKRKRYHRSKRNSSSSSPELQSRKTRRRKVASMEQNHESWREEKALSSSQQTVHWIPTHLWHVKRFRVDELWGWKVPAVHSNRGAKAVLRLVREGMTVISDVSYCMQPIWFQCKVHQFEVLAAQLVYINCHIKFPEEPASFCSGESILHHIGCFPARAIVPATWIVSRRALLNATNASDMSLFCYIFVHPATRTTVVSLLSNLELPNMNGPQTALSSGLACFQLRGRNALECLADSLGTSTNFAFDEVQCTKLKSQDQISSIDGGMFSLHITVDESNLAVLNLRIVAKRPSDLPSNWGACGLDVFCSPTIAKTLFLSLTIHGRACPIGLVEQAHLLLECEPPLQIFPRDYPDTDDGVAYWTNTSKDWCILRSLYEGGQGRIITSTGSHQSLNWGDLVRVIPDKLDQPAVMVRGEFGVPFLKALDDSCKNRTISISQPKFRKLRRARSDPRVLTKSPALSASQAVLHSGNCEQLLNSLSLPALIACQVRIQGRGRLICGETLFAVSAPNIPLGFVTIGCFSQARGGCYGLAIVGAARFLEAVASVRDSNAILTSRETSAVYLEVRIGSSSSGALRPLFDGQNVL